MSDLIDRQMAIDTIMGQPPEPHYPSWYAAQIEKLPAVQPDHNADSDKKVSISCGHENDLISRAAAISHVDDVSYIKEHPNVGLLWKAWIESLPSAQPATNCSEIPNGSDDTISRQAAINAALEDVSGKRTHEFNAGAIRAVNRIKSLPSAQPERKQGKWIYGEHDVAMCDGYRCDKCGFFVPWDYQHKFIDFINDYHFCPSCGADMRGGTYEQA